jgi:hypothetical protein
MEEEFMGNNRFCKLAGQALPAALCLMFAATAHGATRVPITFDEYHGFTGTVRYLQEVARANPDITELVEIGKSTMGRPLYVLVISNMKTGTTIDAHVELRNMRKEGVENVSPMKSYQGKPGHWICGSTHGNEYTGTEVCLYTIDKLISGYGSDDEITRLIDDKTFYICPIVNPDGVFNSVEKGISQRQNSMNIDDDGDGRINEDGPDDLNGDGHITRFRYRDPEGSYIIDDRDARIMIRLGRGQDTAKERYTVITEDRDNDNDGARGEDPERGIDLNRNYPEGWFRDNGMRGGTGDYPTSAPETFAIAEFFTNHRNILMSQFYHTSGGFTYRAIGTGPHTRMHPKDVAVFDFIMGKKYLELIGEEVPQAWRQPARLDEFKAQMKEEGKNKYAVARGYELPRGWRVSYNENQDRRYGYGMATDWAYLQYGMYSITTELWNPLKDIPGLVPVEDSDPRLGRQRALLKYQDEKYDGKLFVPWQPFEHPELGAGEVGGWISQYSGGNAFPGEPLLNVCEKHWQFSLFRAGLLPKLEITRADATILYNTDSAREASAAHRDDEVTVERGAGKGKYQIVQVTATIENQGPLATHVARGTEMAGNREDGVWLIGDRDRITFLQGTPFQGLGVFEGQMEIPGYREGTAAGAQPARRMQPRLPPGYPQPPGRRQSGAAPQQQQRGPSREVSWLIAVDGDTPLKVVVTSQKGGTVVKNLTIHSNGGVR